LGRTLSIEQAYSNYKPFSNFESTLTKPPRKKKAGKYPAFLVFNA